MSLKNTIDKLEKQIISEKNNRINIINSYKKIRKEDRVIKLINDAKISNKPKIKYQTVKYKNNKYIVGFTNNKDIQYPFIIDYFLKDIVLFMNWYKHKEGYIYSQNSISDAKSINRHINILLYQHNLVMNKLTFDGKRQTKTVDHINRIKSDNRLANLRFQSTTEQNFNQDKRKVKRFFPINSIISIDELPRCVSYKNNKRYDYEFFRVKIRKFPKLGYVEKCSSKGNDKSLVYKFEEIKAYLRYLKSEYPNEFKKLNIEYEKTNEMVKLEKEYYEILQLAGIKTNNKIVNKNYLEPKFDRLSKNEINKLLSIKFDDIQRRSKENELPEDCGITNDMLGEYIKFRSETDKRGSYFVIENHPNHNKKIWYGSSRRTKSIREKFNEAKSKLNELQHISKK